MKNKQEEKQDESNTPKNTWQVSTIHIDLVKGYEYASEESRKKDHYEGHVTFLNDEKHSFKFVTDAEFSGAIMEVVAEKIAEAAQDMADKMKKNVTSI